MNNLKIGKRVSVYRNVVSRRTNGKINICKMHVAIPYGEYYIYTCNNGYLLSLNEIPSRKKDFLFTRCVIVNSTGKSMLTYLNTRDLFNNEPVAVTTFECEGGYFITKSTPFEEENFLRKRVIRTHSGHIDNKYNMQIIRRDMDKLKKDGDVLVCRLHTGSRVYLELFCVTKEQAKNYKTWSHLYTERFNLREFDGCLEFRPSATDSTVHFPFDFLDKEKVKKQSDLKTKITFGVMKVELDPIICDLTGREINRSTERVYTHKVAKSTKDCLHILRDNMYETNSLKENIKTLSSDEELFIKMMKELHNTMKK